MVGAHWPPSGIICTTCPPGSTQLESVFSWWASWRQTTSQVTEASNWGSQASQCALPRRLTFQDTTFQNCAAEPLDPATVSLGGQDP
eukprot:14066904-Alexandrium_andersonii.AAC.1